jgi:hypothetical protein
VVWLAIDLLIQKIAYLEKARPAPQGDGTGRSEPGSGGGGEGDDRAREVCVFSIGNLRFYARAAVPELPHHPLHCCDEQWHQRDLSLCATSGAIAESRFVY